MKETGVLRQLSAIFDTRALGYSSALVAAKVDPDHIDEAAAVISEHPGVSHNYKRNHDYNLWYTVAVPPGDSLAEHIDVLHRESGARVTRTLPTITLYKIGVKLDMTGQTAADAKVEVLEHERPERKAEMPAPDLSELELATIRVVQHDLANVERPFAVYAEQIGMGATEDDVLAVLRSLKERKLMRRFAAVMNHRSAGFKANAMGVWAVPEDQLDEIGPQMAGFAAVSHCYRRPTYDDWPYSVFTMVHGRTARDCEATIDAIRTETGVDEYCLLWSVKEYKKVRLEYFTPEWDTWYAKHADRLTAVRVPERPAARRRRVSHHVPSAAPVVTARRAGEPRQRCCGRARRVASSSASSFECCGFHPARFEPVVRDHERVHQVGQRARAARRRGRSPNSSSSARRASAERERGHAPARRAARPPPRTRANRRRRRCTRRRDRPRSRARARPRRRRRARPAPAASRRGRAPARGPSRPR